MKLREKLAFMGALFVLLCFTQCTTDPIAPVGGIPPNTTTVQDPGEEDLCPQGVISFQHEILPILVSNCAYSGCHDVITAEDDIILDSYENVMKEVKPNDPNNSELYEYIIETDPDDIMPPPPAAPLTNAEITLIENWINQGAENTTCGTSCDSLVSSFVMDIQPMMKVYCQGCHNNVRQDGNINLEGYNNIKSSALDGSLVGSMKHDILYAKMPPTGSKLSDCRIAQVEKWIAEGALDN